MSAQHRISCLGVVILDVLGRPCTDLPPGQLGQRIEEIRITAAGTAAGTAVDLAKLGAHVRLCGCIGEDWPGDFLLNLLHRHGVDTTAVQRTPDAQTSASMLPIRPNGERPAYHVVGANAFFDLHKVDLPELLTDCDQLHIGGPDAMGDFAATALIPVLRHARDIGITTSLDVLGARLDHVAGALRAALPYTDFFMPNEAQLCDLYKTEDVELAATRALDDGARAVVVSLGAAGCLVARDDERHQIPSFPVPVVDTTGCGDAFSAGFLAGLARGADLVEAARLGCAAGALVATGLGSDAGINGFESIRQIAERPSQPAPA